MATAWRCFEITNGGTRKGRFWDRNGLRITWMRKRAALPAVTAQRAAAWMSVDWGRSRGFSNFRRPDPPLDATAAIATPRLFRKNEALIRLRSFLRSVAKEPCVWASMWVGWECLSAAVTTIFYEIDPGRCWTSLSFSGLCPQPA